MPKDKYCHFKQNGQLAIFRMHKTGQKLHDFETNIMKLLNNRGGGVRKNGFNIFSNTPLPLLFEKIPNIIIAEKAGFHAIVTAT